MALIRGRETSASSPSSERVILIGEIKPILATRTEVRDIPVHNRDSLLLFVNSLLVKETPDRVSSSLINQLRSPELRIEVSLELINKRGRARQSITPRLNIDNDTNIEIIQRRLEGMQRLHTHLDRDVDTNEKNSFSAHSFGRTYDCNAQVHELPLPGPPVLISQASDEEVFSAFSIYISDQDGPIAVPAETLDPLTTAIHKLDTLPNCRDMFTRDGPALWLSRLDPRALHRYSIELTDTLVNSITTAFEMSDL